MASCGCKSERDTVKESVKDFYGKRVKRSQDLQTNATATSSACAFNKVPQHVRQALKLCHEEVVTKYYGCGLVFPECLEGTHVLDLGCGSGRDCYVLSKLVGEEGYVTGVDMTQEQLDTANKYIEYHTDKFGYSKPNTDFKMGDIEKLEEAGIPDNSQDIIVSNCVINLTTDKKLVLQESHRVLKEGGEVYFSDVYADRILSDEIRKHEVLWGVCIAGALWWRQLVDLCKEVGLSGPYLVTGHKMAVKTEEMQQVLGDAKFVSATYRLFKIPRCDDSKETYEATYKGSMVGNPDEFKFDVFTTFKTGKPHPISATIAEILRRSRFAKHFEVNISATPPSVTEPDAYAIANPFCEVEDEGLGSAESGGLRAITHSATTAETCCASAGTCCEAAN